MEATMVSDAPKHYPVLLNEIINIITPQHGGTFIDCTFGQGGYTKEILKFNKTKVIALDRDIESKIYADEILKKFRGRFTFKNKKFSQLENLKLKNENIKAVIFDLGYSYSQIKDPKKGLSFESDGKLNMKMGINEFSANEVVNKLDQIDLEKIFKFFGEEKDSRKISKKIIQERRIRNIDSKTLVQIIEKTKIKSKFKIHSATKIFQALRIFVNKEITELIQGLISASKILKKDGILLIVSFHSLEDKIVKYFFKSISENKSISRYVPALDEKEKLFTLVKKKPIRPSKKEIIENIPSRSAKLRYVIKKKDFYKLETDIKNKFNHLLEIEKLGDKL
tara:strand:+ start:691 stop:1701 length:1011 start_codon:yes stop_codon:yes gene_type:complete